MPKQKVEFIAVLDDDSEDEIEVIPYVKPVPEVIELLESESDGNENENISKKKKKKKKKSRKEKELSSTNVASNESDPSSSANLSAETGDNHLLEPNESPIRQGDHERTEISQEKNSVLHNVANDAFFVSCDSTTRRGSLQNLEDKLSSNYEQCNGTPSIVADVPGETLTVAEIIETAQTPSKKDRKSVTNEKKRRTRTNSATQRTNEEIVNFLTTLGIQMEPSAFETPPKRRRQSKKRPSEGPSDETTDESQPATAISSTVVQIPDETSALVDTVPGAFVSVTQEVTKASSAKGKKQRTAVVGDISDFRISSDRTSLLTSFQSNLLNLEKKSETPETVPVAPVSEMLIVIDAVARGVEIVKDDLNRNNSLVETQKSDKVSPVETSPVSEKTILDETQPERVSISVDNELPKPEGLQVAEISKQTVDVPKSNDHLITSDPQLHNLKGLTEPRTKTEKTTKSPDRKRSRESDSESNAVEVPSHKAKPITQTCIFVPSSNEFTIEIPTPHLPSTWTNEMKEFYDSSGNENFDCSKLMRRMSDSYGKWAVCNDLMGAPRNKRRHIRCENCNQFGHFRRECTERKKVPCCHMCGEEGHTSDHRVYSRRPCPEALCLNCGRKQPQYSQRCNQCLMRWDPKRCETCNVLGHHKSVCPDNWRSFHSVTSPQEYDKAVIYLQSKSSSSYNRNSSHSAVYVRKSSSFCCNCGLYGHLYYDCNGNRFNPYSRNKPFVVREIPNQIISPPVSVQTSSKSVAVPISYDAKTGRTVVMNAQEKKRPKLAVETIQVKITNELAINPAGKLNSSQLKSDMDVVIKTRLNDKEIQLPIVERSTIPKVTSQTGQCNHGGCTNKTLGDGKCVQTILQIQAHSKLMKAQDGGTLKPFEVKHAVQICVLNEGYKMHIYGDKVEPAEKDLYRYLWQLDSLKREAEQANKEKCGKENAPTQPSVPVFTLEEDDDDDCCIIEELPVPTGTPVAQSPGKSAFAAMAESVKESIDSAQFEIDETSCSFTSDGPCGINYYTFETNQSKGKRCDASADKDLTPPPAPVVPPPQVVVVPPTPSSSKGLFVEYESPLAGMSFDESLVESSKEIGQSFDLIEAAETIANCSPDAGFNKDIITVNPNDNPQTETPAEKNMKEKNEDVEIITLDEEDSLNESTSSQPPAHEEKITLLQSEWNLVSSEFLQAESVINSISSMFNVDLKVSKELSYISVQNGTRRNRKIAKDNLVFWLECQSRNSTFHLLPQGYKTLTNPPNDKKSKVVKKSKGPKFPRLNQRKKGKVADNKTKLGLKLTKPKAPSSIKSIKKNGGSIAKKPKRTTKRVKKTADVFIPVDSSPGTGAPSPSHSKSQNVALFQGKSPNGARRNMRYYQTP